MKLLMISGDRSVLAGKKGAFWNTLSGFAKEWERVDVICPIISDELRATSDGISRNSSPVARNHSDGIQVSDEFPNVYFHPCPHGLWYQPHWISKKGSELIRAHGHEVMTVHEYPPFYNGLGAWALHRKTGVPYCLEIHHIVGDPVASSISEWVGRWMSYICLRFDARSAKKVRVVNKSVKEKLIQWGIPKDKLTVVPSFYLDADVLKSDPSIEKTFDVVFSGRLVENKGILELLEAMKGIPGATLLVLGDGPLLTRVKQMAEDPQLRGRVTFRGWVPDHKALAEEMQSGKIFVMNSKSEGGPRVVLEAMALGLPVIATNVGVVPEVIRSGKNGIITDGSRPDLQRQITLLLKDPDLCSRIGRNAESILGIHERKKALAGYASFLQSLAR